MENEKYGSLDNQGSQAKAKQTRPYWQQRKLRKNKAALARKSRQSKILDTTAWTQSRKSWQPAILVNQNSRGDQSWKSILLLSDGTVQPELGKQQQHCRDNVTIFSSEQIGHHYYIRSIIVVGCGYSILDTKTLTFLVNLLVTEALLRCAFSLPRSLKHCHLPSSGYTYKPNPR